MTEKSVLYTLLAILAGGLAVVAVLLSTPQTYAGAPSGLPARVASTTNPTVGTTAAVIIATSTCSARIITTYASPVMLTFSDRINQTPTGTFGHLQGASTTVAYDSGLYGCGLVKAYSFATQAITVSDVE